MKTFNFCPRCGSKTIRKLIGDEGEMPYCPECKRPLFPMFKSAVIVMVVNEFNELALIRQRYRDYEFNNMVSGYIKPEEWIEDTAKREVLEEIGVRIDNLKYKLSYWFEPTHTLMIGFFAKAQKCNLIPSRELVSAKWIPVDESREFFTKREDNVALMLLDRYLKENM